MALVKCPMCGKEISDLAQTCPFCGHPMPYVAKNTRICLDCGNEVDASLTSCPHCGRPFETAVNPAPVQTTAPTEEKPKKKHGGLIIMLIILAVVIAALVFVGVKKKQEERYQHRINSAVSEMLDGAAKAEAAATLIHDVWYDAVFDNYSEADTKKYLKGASDFNEALSNLLSDEDFKVDQKLIWQSQNRAEADMKGLLDPPDKYDRAYDAVKDLYDVYLDLTNLALNPSGSLQSYTADFNEADSDFMTKYNAAQLYVD